jgi:hypothetical protein
VTTHCSNLKKSICRCVTLANLGIDSNKLASGGWKLTKESVAAILPDLKEVIEQINEAAPVILVCLDNTCFKVATAEGELTNITKCVAEDDGYHINRDLVVAPEIFIKGQTVLLKQLIENCGTHIIYILCPVPRFVTFRCCDDPSHCTNFSDPDYLPTVLADLKKVRDIISREIPTARVLDTLELMMGPGKEDAKTKEEAVRTHWAMDPVHATLHSYYKLASNLMDYHKNFREGKNEVSTTAMRPRKNYATTEGEPETSGSTNPSKKRREETKEMEAGSHRDTRHWPPSGPHHHQQDRGFGFTNHNEPVRGPIRSWRSWRTRLIRVRQ